MSTIIRFTNTGNDCYLNSVFQLLLNIPEYIEYLLDRKRNNLPLSTLEKVFFIINKKKELTDTMQIFELLNHVNPVEYDGTQKDAGEFLFKVLENFVDNNPTMLTKQVYKRTCNGCDNHSISENIQFPVYVEKYNLENFIIPEPDVFHDITSCDIEMKCQKCSHSLHNEKHGYRSRKLLILCIKRFCYDLTKDNSPIGNLIEFSQGKKLVSVLCHYGTTSSGHYFTINFIDDKWYLLNDDKVEEITTEQVIRYAQHLGYILVYKLV